jgi:hypothetical protein
MLKDIDEQQPPPPLFIPGGIRESKFMLIVQTYPNGQVYVKTFPIGSPTTKSNTKKKKNTLKLIGSTIMEEEAY